MNQEKLIELGRGYAIFFLCLFIFTMWGINLFSISQTEENTLLSVEGDQELVETGTIRNVSIKPRPFLYFYLKELGFRVSITSTPPGQQHALLLIIDPPETFPQETLREVFRWIRDGGDVIMFMPKDHRMDRFLGVTRNQAYLEQSPSISLYLPFLQEVETVSVYEKGATRDDGMSFFSIFPESLQSSPVLFSARGKGRLIIASHKDFLYGEGLMRNDNLVLVTRLIEHLSPEPQLYLLDTRPNRYIQALTKSMVRKSSLVKAKIKKDHLTFFSLFKANPISWVLVQMIIALLIYFISTAKRFGKPIKMPETTSGSGSFVKQIGSLLHEKDDRIFALSEILSDFAILAIQRFGLKENASLKEIIAAVSDHYPDTAKSLQLSEHEIQNTLKGRAPSDNSLLRVVRTIESARKELKLYD